MTEGQIEKRRTAAIIDIGSNAVRLIFYDIKGTEFEKLHVDRVMAVLGKGLDQTGRLDPEGSTRALETFQSFREQIETQNASPVVAIATAAVRDAGDGPAFIEQAGEALGIPVQVLSGAEEAQYAAVGVMAGGLGTTAVIGDLGGGSLELIATENGHIVEQISLPVGTRRPDNLENVLQDQTGFTERYTGRDFVAIGGAWRALAEAHITYTEHFQNKLHGYAIIGPAMGQFAADISQKPDEELQRLMKNAERGTDGLAIGAGIMARLFETLKPANVMFSTTGMREGALMRALQPEYDSSGQQGQSPHVSGPEHPSRTPPAASR